MGRALSMIFSKVAAGALKECGFADLVTNISPMWYLLAFAVLAWKIYDTQKLCREQQRRIKATLINKQELEEWVVQNVEPSYYKKQRYVLTFQATNKKNYSIDVSKWIFARYAIGDKGKLTYKIIKNETRFVDFVKDNKK